MIAFGNAADGQLGLGGIEETSIHFARWNKHLKEVDVVSVGCGLKHTLMLLGDGRVLSCGSNEKGQLGQEESHSRPGAVSSLSSHFIVQLACGHYHSLALSKSGCVFSWGDGQNGQLGLGPDQLGPSFSPREVSFVSGKGEKVQEEVVQVACGAHHNLALFRDGQVYAWGQNNHFQLGVESDQQSFLSVPIPVASLQSVPVVFVSSGFAHNVAVTAGGVALSWGRNSYGQLGIGTTQDQQVPGPLRVLVEDRKTVTFAACGDEHTLLLTAEGEVYSCGLNNHGQLGVGSTTNKYLPTHVRMLNNSVCQVTCGRMHSAAMTSSDGIVFMFGQNTHGQVGVVGVKSLMIPTDINLGHPPHHQMTEKVLERLRKAVQREELADGSSNKKLKQDIPENGSSVDVSPVDVARTTHLEYAPIQVFCGGDQSFVNVDMVTTQNCIEVFSGRHTQEAPPPVDLRIPQHRKLLYMAEHYLEELLGAGGDHQLPYDRVMNLISKVFSSSTLLGGSFLFSRDCPVNDGCPGIELSRLARIRDLLREKLHRHHNNHSSSFSLNLLNIKPRPPIDVDSSIEKSIEDYLRDLFLSMTSRPSWVEGLRSLLMAPFWFMGGARSNHALLLQYVKTVMKLNEESRQLLMKWYFQLGLSYVEMIWKVIKNYMTQTIGAAYSRYMAKEKNFFPQADEADVHICLKLVQNLHKANSGCGDKGISCDDWHISQLTEFIDIPEDYLTFLENKPAERIVWCHYPFLLDARAKSVIMNVDCLLSMKLAVTQAHSHNFHRILTGQILSDMSPESFTLIVDRNNLVDSTVVQLSHSTENFKKPLRIQFLGEEGEDGGGMAKEFFMLLSQRILSPDFGMFMEDDESHLSWFRDGELFYEHLEYYKIIGILCGLAIYNSVTVYLPFPMALYKKLLAKSPSFKDFMQLFPSMAKSIEEILQYSGNNFEEVFDLNFTITRYVLGEVVVKELVTNGNLRMVTKDNREQYCQRYMDYFMKSSIQKQFEAFQEGFLRVCEGKVLKLLDPEDLMALVVGEQVQNWEEMKKITEYRNGYSKDSAAVSYFWETFNEFSKDLKNKFLVFLTGTNRIPVEGFKRMRIFIQRMDGGPNCERLPVAHTCFNILDLPPYSSKRVMRDKLLQAMSFTAGFGLI